MPRCRPLGPAKPGQAAFQATAPSSFLGCLPPPPNALQAPATLFQLARPFKPLSIRTACSPPPCTFRLLSPSSQILPKRSPLARLSPHPAGEHPPLRILFHTLLLPKAGNGGSPRFPPRTLKEGPLARPPGHLPAPTPFVLGRPLWKRPLPALFRLPSAQARCASPPRGSSASPPPPGRPRLLATPSRPRPAHSLPHRCLR